MRKLVAIFLIVFLGFIAACEYDKLLLISKPVIINDTNYISCPCDTSRYHDCDCDTLDPERCLCDTTGYRDCDCDREDPYPFVCDCDTSVWRDCECDFIDPYKNPCPCNTTKYRDCDCDVFDPPVCPCDTTQYRDCDCDILDPEYCACDTTPWRDCHCDYLQPEFCACDTSKYKDPGCWCDNDTEERPIIPIQSVKYSQHIQPIWNNYCTLCHDELSTTNINLKAGYSWNALQNFIMPGYPDISKLVEYISGASPFMPQNPPYLNENEVNLVRKWIEQGAKND